MPRRDELGQRAKPNGGGRKPILVRLFRAWEAAHRRNTDEFIRRHMHFNSFY
jgi:hypothetical protein